MIEVRLRHANDATGVHLTEVFLDDLDKLIPTLKAWGLAIDGDLATEPLLYGQFRLADSAAYFEIVVEPQQ